MRVFDVCAHSQITKHVNQSVFQWPQLNAQETQHEKKERHPGNKSQHQRQRHVKWTMRSNHKVPKERAVPPGKAPPASSLTVQILPLDQACAPGKPQGQGEVAYGFFLLPKEGTQAKRSL